MTSLRSFLCLCLLASVAFMADAFAPNHGPSTKTLSVKPSLSTLQAAPVDVMLTTSTAAATTTNVAATTLDPTTFLTDILGVFINSNAILAVPVIAALGVASLIAWGIVAYASPAEPEEDDV
ncbi:expressed unknown protein [Seminavis robusta]|uniref:Uncharacterized protein n=1 Tax=Seminavis robusta TaxID=568900 RepID=A0A9N8E4Q1_9STRA|nr:expressed unknown protein [Seminavis robusta]|eukprot:Sro665_g183800.1 n/a (122) ;mRNA; r:13216-13581